MSSDRNVQHIWPVTIVIPLDESYHFISSIHNQTGRRCDLDFTAPEQLKRANRRLYTEFDRSLHPDIDRPPFGSFNQRNRFSIFFYQNNVLEISVARRISHARSTLGSDNIVSPHIVLYRSHFKRVKLLIQFSISV